MIAEFSMRIKPKNRAGMIIFLSAMTVGAFLFVYSSSLDSYRGVVGLAALTFFVAALFVYTKYIAPEYFYDITLSDGEPLLLVRQLVGRRGTVMCRIALADITKIDFTDKGWRSTHKTPDGYKKYNYTVTIGVQNAVLLTVNSRHENCEILLEGESELSELLERYRNEARAMMPETYE